MNPDVFGDLRDWGRVLDLLEQLKDARGLNEHQAGLVRLLRYPENWQLREAALRASSHVDAPSNELLSQLATMVADRRIDRDARMLAAHALGGLLAIAAESPERRRAVRSLEVVLGAPAAPVLHDAVRKALAATRQTAAAAS